MPLEWTRPSRPRAVRCVRTAFFVRLSAPASSLTVRLPRRSRRIMRPRVLTQKRSFKRVSFIRKVPRWIERGSSILLRNKSIKPLTYCGFGHENCINIEACPSRRPHSHHLRVADDSHDLISEARLEPVPTTTRGDQRYPHPSCLPQR